MKKIVFYIVSAVLLCPRIVEAVFVGPPSSSAGVVERQLEKEYEAKEVPFEREVPLLEIDIPEQKLVLPEGKKISIIDVEFSGNDLYSSWELKDLAGSYLNRDITMKDVQELCLKVQAFYVKNGYFLTRVFPPEQTVRDRVLRLEVMEGKLGDITIVDNKHYTDKYIRKYFSDFQDKPVNYDQLMRALLLVNENRDLNIAMVLKKGSKLGYADIILRATDKTPVHFYADYNRYGSHITTTHRTGARLDWGNCIFQGDTLSLTEVVGLPVKRLNFSDIIYNVPINATGTRIELSYLISSFKIDTLEELRLKGNAQVAELKVSQAVFRKKMMDVDVFGTFDYKNLRNLALGETTSLDKLRILGVGMSVDYSDKLWGRNIASGRLYAGIPDLFNGSEAVDPRCSRIGAGGRFFILNADYKRIQTLGGNCYLLLNFSGQGTTYKLPLAQQIYIGGFDSVRGYTLAAALGDTGYFANLELRVPIPFLANKKVPWMKKTWKEFVQFVGFVDHGDVFLNGGGEDQVNHIALTGAGAGVRVFGPWHLDYTLDVGYPLTPQEKTSTTVVYFKISINVP